MDSTWSGRARKDAKREMRVTRPASFWFVGFGMDIALNVRLLARPTLGTTPKSLRFRLCELNEGQAPFEAQFSLFMFSFFFISNMHKLFSAFKSHSGCIF